MKFSADGPDDAEADSSVELGRSESRTTDRVTAAQVPQVTQVGTPTATSRRRARTRTRLTARRGARPAEPTDRSVGFPQCEQNAPTSLIAVPQVGQYITPPASYRWIRLPRRSRSPSPSRQRCAGLGPRLFPRAGAVSPIGACSDFERLSPPTTRPSGDRPPHARRAGEPPRHLTGAPRAAARGRGPTMSSPMSSATSTSSPSATARPNRSARSWWTCVPAAQPAPSRWPARARRGRLAQHATDDWAAVSSATKN